MRRIALPLVVAAIVFGAVVPGNAATYTKTYYGSTAGVVILRTNPASDFGNPSNNGNPAALVKGLVGYTGIAAVDSVLGTVYGTLDGSPANQNPLDGTPADQNLLEDTPADAELFGAYFPSFAGVPKTIKVTDEAAKAADLPVRWVARQCTVGTSPCPANRYVRTYGCSKAGQAVALTGFVSGRPISVWIVTNDSAGLWDSVLGNSCDSVASTGTITLTTL